MKLTTCSRCGERKLLNEFYKDRTQVHGYKYECKECVKKMRKDYYHRKGKFIRDPIRTLELQRAQLARYKKRWVEEIEKRFGNPLSCPACEYCGPFPVFDFHHFNKKDHYRLSQFMIRKPTDVRINELDKGIFLCSNCHRLLHHGENND